jgi:formylglycine-generating enzyme required for sulfatase activity
LHFHSTACKISRENQFIPGARKTKPGFVVKTKFHLLFLVLALFAGLRPAAAQTTRFVRISGPGSTTLLELRPDGSLVWINAQIGTNYTVQTVSSLSGGGGWMDYVQLHVTNAVNTNLLFAFNPPAGMTLVPAGFFTMGDTLDRETDAVPTNATVSGFYMDANLVSYAQWQAVFDYATNHGYGFVNAGAGAATNQPVQTVDWYDAVKWCNARSQQAGLTPVYYLNTNFTQIYTNGEVTPFANWTNNGYRLPTEAEWEKAARGGLSGLRFPWGDTISETQANYYSDPFSLSYDLGPAGYSMASTNDAFPFTTSVGYFSGNGYGLFDIAGNVSEWCWDWYGTPYAGGTDPRGPSSSPNSARVTRGGNWDDLANGLTCANRHFLAPNIAFDNYGFRCARGL